LPHDATAEYILSRCRDVENCPEETLAPYQEFVEERKVYYFTPGGSSTAGTPGPRRWEASSAATSPTRFGTIERTIASTYA